MHVALFGGSFNPPHLGHQLAALYALETSDVDQLWFVPCFRHPFEKQLESFDDRLHMCRAAAEPLGPRAKVKDIERELGGTSRTLTTVRALKAQYPEVRFSLVIGSDLLDEIDSWYGAQTLRQLISFLVVGRQGTATESAFAIPNISSTDVRERLLSGDGVEAIVPRGVLAFIRDRGLYGPSGAPL